MAWLVSNEMALPRRGSWSNAGSGSASLGWLVLLTVSEESSGRKSSSARSESESCRGSCMSIVMTLLSLMLLRSCCNVLYSVFLSSSVSSSSL